MIRSHRQAISILVLVILLVYGRTLAFDFVQLDDSRHLLENDLLKAPWTQALAAFWKAPYFFLYIPVTYTFWFLTAKLSLRLTGTLHPSFFHFLNFLFHLLNATLVYFLASNLLQRTRSPASEKQLGKKRKQESQEAEKALLPLAALSGALWFLLHPIQVESVSWISSFKETLSFFFGILSLIFLFKNEKSVRNEGIGFLFFLLSIFSKPTWVILPFLAAVVQILIFKRPLKEKIVSIGLWFLSSIILIWVTKGNQPDLNIIYVAPYWQRPLLAGACLFHYIVKTLFPWTLLVDYAKSIDRIAADELSTLLAFVASVMVFWLFYLFRRKPLPLLGMTIFLLGLFPILGFIPYEYQNFSAVADRYLYLPMAGIGLLFSHFCLQSWKAESRYRYAFFAILALLGIRTFAQVGTWKNSTVLFEALAEKNPESYLAFYTLGNEEYRANRFENALKNYQQAIKLKPGSIWAQQGFGATLLQLGRNQEAAEHYQKWLEHAEDSPSSSNRAFFGEMAKNYSVALQRLGQNEAAQEQSQRAARLGANPR
jgi:hypothetical protein